MTDPRYIHFEHHGRRAVGVTTFPPHGTDRRSAAVQAFRAEAKARLVENMAMSAGADDAPPGVTAPLVSFHFEAEHLPLPFEEILEWLRGHPLVRVIEIEWYGADERPPNER